MKKLSILFLSAVALTTTFTSCSDDEPTPAKTALQLVMKDFNNNSAILPNVSVNLYDSTTAESPIKSGKSGTDGKVLFNDLKSQIYYFAAGTDDTAGCKTNLYTTQTSGTTAIPAGKTTSVDVLMVSEGTITLTINTTSDYLISFKLGQNDYKPFGKISGKENAEDQPVVGSFKFLSGTYSMQLTPIDANNNPIGDSIVTDVTLDACGDFPFAIN